MRYFASQTNPADEAKYKASDEEYGLGNDLKQFEMAKKSKWQNQKGKKLGDRSLSDFSKTVVVIDSRFDALDETHQDN